MLFFSFFLIRKVLVLIKAKYFLSLFFALACHKKQNQNIISFLFFLSSRLEAASTFVYCLKSSFLKSYPNSPFIYLRLSALKIEHPNEGKNCYSSLPIQVVLPLLDRNYRRPKKKLYLLQMHYLVLYTLI